MSRGSRGPRQPGGGRQIAGPRYSFPPHTRGAGGGEGRRAKRAGVGGASARQSPPTPDPSPPRRAAPWGEGKSTVQNVSVTDDESGMRVDRFLQARIPDLSFARIVRNLLDAGEAPDRYNPLGFHSHSTPLHQAALAGHDELVRFLVERGASVAMKDIQWQGTPADWAERGGHTELAAYLRAQQREIES